MRILVFSDSHGDVSVCGALINKIPGTEMVIHAGDCAADAKKLSALFPDKTVKFVRGNCDYTVGEDELNFCVCDKNIFVAHGHRYNVKTDYDYRAFRDRAAELNADLAIFGHTHNPYCDNNGRMILLNPGSIRYGRTFGIVEIDGERITADICDANSWINNY